mmetsp:Transcript_1247/g.4097  ORF Transcript_1247/g.4097 Transcript_1247/m.4097 type:complete len:297 (+) Transcript_1247:587-1477(+)
MTHLTLLITTTVQFSQSARGGHGRVRHIALESAQPLGSSTVRAARGASTRACSSPSRLARAPTHRGGAAASSSSAPRWQTDGAPIPNAANVLVLPVPAPCPSAARAGRLRTKPRAGGEFRGRRCLGPTSLIGRLDLPSDGVEIALARLRNAPATLARRRRLLEDLHLLELRKDVPRDRAAREGKLLLDGAAALATTVDLAHRANTHVAAQVHAARDRRRAHVVPVRVVRRELASLRRLDKVGPFGQLDLACALQVRGVRDDEVTRRHVLHSHTARPLGRRVVAHARGHGHAPVIAL